MPPFPFSSFRRFQVNFEMRYDQAFLLWDRAGELWTSVGTGFKSIKANQVQPQQQTFIADDRFVLFAGLERAGLTDHKPHQPAKRAGLTDHKPDRPAGGAEKTTETAALFAEKVIETLELKVLERVGLRYIFSMSCKSIDEAREKACIAVPAFGSRPYLLNVKPSSFGPTIKLEADDGDFAYTAQLLAQERKFEFSPPPEAADVGLERIDRKMFELVFDVDCYTKKPVRVDAFDCKSWLQGWNKAVSQDADAVLDYLAGKRG